MSSGMFQRAHRSEGKGIPFRAKNDMVSHVVGLTVDVLLQPLYTEIYTSTFVLNQRRKGQTMIKTKDQQCDRLLRQKAVCRFVQSIGSAATWRDMQNQLNTENSPAKEIMAAWAS